MLPNGRFVGDISIVLRAQSVLIVGSPRIVISAVVGLELTDGMSAHHGHGEVSSKSEKNNSNLRKYTRKK